MQQPTPPLVDVLRTGVMVLGLLAAAQELSAQVDDEVISGLQFNFTPPGARSLGLGGAFVAVANDATAAFANPAGLVQLTRREVSLEGRRADTRALFSRSGRAAGEAPTGLGIDTVAGLELGETETSTEGLSFLSYVEPLGRLRLAFYRHEVVNFASEFTSDGPFYNFFDEDDVACESFAVGLDACERLFPIDTSMRLRIDNLGGAVAFQVSDELSLGVGLSFFSFDMDATTRRFDVVAPDFLGPGGFFGPPSFADSNVFATQQQVGSDDQIGWNVGLLWQPSRRVSWGLAHTSGAEFDYRYTITCGPSDPGFCREVPGLAGGVADFGATFGLPSVTKLGFAWRPIDALTVAVDVARVGYSALTDDFLVATNEGSLAEDFVAEDQEEFHLGAEYVFARLVRPLAVRAGAWLDPRHQIEYRATAPASTVSQWAGSAAADDEWHWTAGIGWTVSEWFSVDAAGDWSERYDIMSLSAVVRF